MPFVGLRCVPVYFFRMPKDRKTFYANYNNNNNILPGVCSTGSSTPWMLSKNHITCLRKGKTVILVLFLMSTVFSRNSKMYANITCTTELLFFLRVLMTFFIKYRGVTRKYLNIIYTDIICCLTEIISSKAQRIGHPSPA